MGTEGVLEYPRGTSFKSQGNTIIKHDDLLNKVVCSCINDSSEKRNTRTDLCVPTNPGCHSPRHITAEMFLTVGFLVTGTGSWPTKLLGLASARIGNEQRPVVLDENILDLLLGGFVDDCKQETKICFVNVSIEDSILPQLKGTISSRSTGHGIRVLVLN